MRRIQIPSSKGATVSDVLRTVILITVSLLAFASGAPGSSVIDERLATLGDVSVKVTGGLLYEPVPGLDRKGFERRIKDAAQHELVKCDISTNDSSHHHLLISFDKIAAPVESADLFVFRVDIELREPAALVRPLPQADTQSAVYVTSWRSRDVLVARDEESLDALLESVRYQSLTFAQRVAAARAEFKGDSAASAPSRCFDEFSG